MLNKIGDKKMDRVTFAKMIERLKPLIGYENLEYNIDFYYEFVSDMDEDTFRNMLRNILENEDYFPNIRKWKRYAIKFQSIVEDVFLYELYCEKCNKRAIHSSNKLLEDSNTAFNCNKCGEKFEVKYLGKYQQTISKLK
jgi:DNA-binding XRE family transcriptional regulator